MTTRDAGSGGPSGRHRRDSRPSLAAEPELDAYGLPVRDRPVARGIYRLSLASLACGIVSIGLAITDLVAYGMLAGYLVALGMVSGFVGAGLGGYTAEVMLPKSGKGKQVEVVRRMCKAGLLLGFLGFIGLVIGSGHGAALNSTP